MCVNIYKQTCEIFIEGAICEGGEGGRMTKMKAQLGTLTWQSSKDQVPAMNVTSA